MPTSKRKWPVKATRGFPCRPLTAATGSPAGNARGHKSYQSALLQPICYCLYLAVA